VTDINKNIYVKIHGLQMADINVIVIYYAWKCQLRVFGAECNAFPR
jgi:hypothetical protein